MTTPPGIAADVAGCVVDWQEDGNRLQARCRYPDDMGILAGHFPGRPLVPGVYCLELTLWLLRSAGVACTLPYHIRRAKFASPILPAEPFTVDIQLGASEEGRQRIRARFRSDETSPRELAHLDLQLGS